MIRASDRVDTAPRAGPAGGMVRVQQPAFLEVMQKLVQPPNRRIKATFAQALDRVIPMSRLEMQQEQRPGLEAVLRKRRLKCGHSLGSNHPFGTTYAVADIELAQRLRF
jgi:hypothetical protein